MNRDKLIKEIIEAGYPEDWAKGVIYHRVRVEVPVGHVLAMLHNSMGVVVDFMEPNYNPWAFCVLLVGIPFSNISSCTVWLCDDEFTIVTDQPLGKGRCKAVILTNDECSGYSRCCLPEGHGVSHGTVYGVEKEAVLTWKQDEKGVCNERRKLLADRMHSAQVFCLMAGKKQRVIKYRRWRDSLQPGMIEVYHEMDKTDEEVYALTKGGVG